ncbi:alpha/beta hydrolase [Alcaligenaceae bacterium]|nr:alpha/beta hydrolase [Alcaligenaceae bacterium]
MLPTHALPQYSIDIHGDPVHYTVAGNGEILLLIHGSLCDYRYWRWQIPALSQHHKVLAPSLRGYWPAALQRETAAFNIAQHVSDMVAFARQMGSGRPIHILGHSRGAQIALELACQAPELVRSLTLADPGFRIAGEAPSFPFHMSVISLLERGEVEQALSEFIDVVNGSGTWRHMVSWFKTMVTDNAYTLLSQVREINLGVDLAEAHQLRCPVLLVGGADSPIRYGSRLDILEDVFNDVQRVTIPLASHGMNLANPKAFNQELSEFLAEVEAGGTGLGLRA